MAEARPRSTHSLATHADLAGVIDLGCPGLFRVVACLPTGVAPHLSTAALTAVAAAAIQRPAAAHTSEGSASAPALVPLPKPSRGDWQRQRHTATATAAPSVGGVALPPALDPDARVDVTRRAGAVPFDVACPPPRFTVLGPSPPTPPDGCNQRRADGALRPGVLRRYALPPAAHTSPAPPRARMHWRGGASAAPEAAAAPPPRRGSGRCGRRGAHGECRGHAAAVDSPQRPTGTAACVCNCRGRPRCGVDRGSPRRLSVQMLPRNPPRVPHPARPSPLTRRTPTPYLSAIFSPPPLRPPSPTIPSLYSPRHLLSPLPTLVRAPSPAVAGPHHHGVALEAARSSAGHRRRRRLRRCRTGRRHRRRRCRHAGP